MRLNPCVFYLNHWENQLLINSEIIFPKFIPKLRFENLPKSNHEPVDKTFLTPALSYSFHSFHHSTKSTFNSIGIHRNPSLSLKPAIKRQPGILREVPDVGSRFRILLRIKGINQSLKPSFYLFNQLHHNLFLWREDFLQFLLFNPEKRVVFQ